MNIRLIFLSCLLAGTACTAEPARPELACAAYTFRKDTLFGAIEKAAQCGVRYIETFTNLPLSPDDPTRIYELSDVQLERLRAHLKKHGVEIASCMGAVPKDEARARAFFATAVRLGARNLGTDSVESVDTIEKIIGDYDLTVAFHNHPTNPQKPEYRNSDPHFMSALLKGRHERIGVCADTGHYATSNVVPLDAVRLLAGRIKSVHLKERAAIGRRTPDQVYGTGVLDLAGILKELGRQGFVGWLVIEYESNPENNLDEVKRCADFVRAQLALPQP
ncbi:MAG: sugar phosphate isomerase/epimerase [Lacunisphaera sp.]|nr:sugar phosphate isomerase/epimerase [Lacunisphaera sp.]